jgi:epoxyqueuosine reductase
VTFLNKTEGSPIRRIGFNSWQRNISVAIGNAPYSAENVNALRNKLATAEPMVAEHINWALHQQDNKRIAAEQQSDFPIKNQRLTERLIRSVEKGLPRDA